MAPRLVVAFALGLLLAASALAAGPPPRCEPDRFLVDGGSLLPGTTGPDVIDIADGRLALLGRCAPARVRLSRGPHAVHVYARWRACGGVERVRLRASVDRDTCRAMIGRLTTGFPRVTRGFYATRAVRTLVFSRTAGFRHPSIADAQRVLGSLAPEEGIVATLTEDPATFTDAALARFDVVLFVNTTGDVLDDAQQAALERFVRAGAGWVGVHSAADTEYGWPWYGRLVGAYFTSHPLLPVEVEVTTEDGAHPVDRRTSPRASASPTRSTTSTATRAPTTPSSSPSTRRATFQLPELSLRAAVDGRRPSDRLVQGVRRRALVLHQPRPPPRDVGRSGLPPAPPRRHPLGRGPRDLEPHRAHRRGAESAWRSPSRPTGASSTSSAPARSACGSRDRRGPRGRAARRRHLGRERPPRHRARPRLRTHRARLPLPRGTRRRAAAGHADRPA